MGKWVYRKREPANIRGLCVRCNKKPQTKSGKDRYKSICKSCQKIASKTYGYRGKKKDYCEKCGFIALDPVQLDVDHIDGDHSNNELSNLQTLCANCHRLKTRINRDHIKK